MSDNNLNIIANALMSSYFCSYINDFSHNELMYLNNVIDYDNIPDRFLVDNEEIYPFIKWDRMSKMKAIRLVSRNLDLINVVDLKKYNYKIREIFWFIKTDYTRLYKFFNFDFNKASHEDVYLLLCIGSEYFEKTIKIEDFKFSFLETFDIIKAYNYKRDIIKRLDYKSLKPHQATEILSKTGEENIDLFNLDILSTINWLELLNYQPEFIYKCNFEMFKKGDSFNLVQLVVLFKEPDLSYLISEIDPKDISPFGWEKLLVCDPEKYIDLCDFSKLNEDNWGKISSHRPELLVYKL